MRICNRARLVQVRMPVFLEKQCSLVGACGPVALFWERLKDDRVGCRLCPQNCNLHAGKIGICMGKQNIDGCLYAINYGKIAALAFDPIEKKPLFHFKPGTWILSVGPNGCNMGCRNCQNWGISQVEACTETMTPSELADLAVQQKSVGLAYTYAEPLIWYEYIRDCAVEIRKRGLVNVIVSNGYLNEEPLRQLAPLIDAANIDVKALDDTFYRRVCKARLAAVLRTVEILHESDVVVEVTNLVIPTLNDSDDDFRKLVGWLAGIDDRIPLHFSRYFPQYQMDLPATPPEALLRAYELARERLKYVYLGNIHIPATEDTHCPDCHSLLVKRKGYTTEVAGVQDGCCAVCGSKTDIHW